MWSSELKKQLQNLQNSGRSVISMYEFTTQRSSMDRQDKQEDLDDQAKNFIDFKRGLDRLFGVARHEDKRQIVVGPTQVLVKLSLDESMKKDETQAAWH
jgi:hypothetical protein